MGNKFGYQYLTEIDKNPRLLREFGGLMLILGTTALMVTALDGNYGLIGAFILGGFAFYAAGLVNEKKR